MVVVGWWWGVLGEDRRAGNRLKTKVEGGVSIQIAAGGARDYPEYIRYMCWRLWRMLHFLCWVISSSSSSSSSSSPSFSS